jgi:hypothetical protein
MSCCSGGIVMVFDRGCTIAKDGVTATCDGCGSRFRLAHGRWTRCATVQGWRARVARRLADAIAAISKAVGQ